MARPKRQAWAIRLRLVDTIITRWQDGCVVCRRSLDPRRPAVSCVRCGSAMHKPCAVTFCAGCLS